MEGLLVIFSNTNQFSLETAFRKFSIKRKLVDFIPYSQKHTIEFEEQVEKSPESYYTLIVPNEKRKVEKCLNFLKEEDNDSTEVDVKFVKCWIIS